MRLFFPDLNVWLALSVSGHTHSAESWKWLKVLADDVRLIFCRYTQLGLLRLLTNEAVMGQQTLTVKHAWDVYEEWSSDPRVEFYPEPRGLDAEFRSATAPFSRQKASKVIGDSYLLAYAKAIDATLATFDRPLVERAKKQGYRVITPE